jgi:Uncharacterized conserved protein
MAFFDGQNLFQHAMKAFGHFHPNYGPQKLHALVCAKMGWTPTLVRFYTGVPDQAHSPMWAAYWSNRVLSMKRAGIHVTTRPLRYHEETVETVQGMTTVLTPQEKGIDIRIALDLVSCAIAEQFDAAVIFSQDQDLAEAVREIRAVGKKLNREFEIACAYPAGPKATAKRGIDKTTWIPLEQAEYDTCLDPHDYRPKTSA